MPFMKQKDMRSGAKVFLTILLVPIIGLLLLALAMGIHMFWPRQVSSSYLTEEIAELLLDDGTDASLICGFNAVHLVHPDFESGDFEKRYKKFHSRRKSPYPQIQLLGWTTSQERGSGRARIEGKGTDWDNKILSPEKCSADISFAYDCGWQDNGVSRKWDCLISNIQIEKH